MPLSRWGITPTDTTPILITNLQLNSQGYDLFKGTVGYEDTITLADNVDGTLALFPNAPAVGPNARTLWIKDGAGVTQLSVDIFTGITTINNLVVNGTASVGFLPGFGQNIPSLIVQGNASIGTLGVGKTTIIGPLNTFSNPASWNPTLIIDDAVSSTNDVVELRTNGTRRGSIVAQSSNNLALSGVLGGSVLLSYLDGTGGTRFGNGAQTTVGSVDSTGLAAFSGYKTFSFGLTASFAPLNVGIQATVTGTVNTSFNPTTWIPTLIVDDAVGSSQNVIELRLQGSRNGSIRSDPSGHAIVNGHGAGSVYLAYDEGTGGVNFGNGAQAIVGSVDSTGKATFNGGLIVPATASFNSITAGGLIVPATASFNSIVSGSFSGRMFNNGVGVSVKQLLYPVPIASPGAHGTSGSGNGGPTAISLATDVPASAVIVAAEVEFSSSTLGDVVSVRGQSGATNNQTLVQAIVVNRPSYGYGQWPITGQQVFYQVTAAGNWTLNLYLSLYYEAA